MTERFQREEPYIVVKLNHLREAQGAPFPDNKIHGLLNYLSATGVKPIEGAVVVEPDWTEHGQVWAMIEHRVTGQPVLSVEPVEYYTATRLKRPGVDAISSIDAPWTVVLAAQYDDHTTQLQAEVAQLKAGLLYESERNALLLERVTELEAEQSTSTECAKS